MSPRYKLVVRPSVEKELAKIPEPYRTKLATAIRDLAYEPRPHGHKKLIGQPLYRIRVGDYRAIYVISDKIVTVTVTKTAHRSKSYKKR